MVMDINKAKLIELLHQEWHNVTQEHQILISDHIIILLCVRYQGTINFRFNHMCCINQEQ